MFWRGKQQPLQSQGAEISVYAEQQSYNLIHAQPTSEPMRNPTGFMLHDQDLEMGPGSKPTPNMTKPCLQLGPLLTLSATDKGCIGHAD